MQDCLKIEACLLIGEDFLAKRGAVEIASRVNHVLAKSASYLIERRLPGLHNLACNNIGVDDRHAQFGEHICDQGFPAGNAAG